MNKVSAVFQFATIFVLAGMTAIAQEQPKEPTAKKDLPSEVSDAETEMVDVEFSRQGGMRMVLRDKSLDLDTPYGKLTIPVKEILRIEFATRFTESEAKTIEDAIAKLGSNEFSVRDAAMHRLTSFGERAYSALVKASKDSDPEVARRAKAAMEKLQQTISAERLAGREFDIVETSHSKIAGTLRATSIAVETAEFGMQELRLADLRSLRSQHAPFEDVPSLRPEADPGNLSRYQAMIGKTFAFHVTGRGDGTVYGTGVYTTDSMLATAAVHCGILKPGESAIVHVRMEESPISFTASTQNGITSNSWGSYPAGYRILRKVPGRAAPGRVLVPVVP
jgi:hypothetical protein